MPLATLKNNRYRIVRPLGSGSTGEVYLVEDNINNRQEVILKLLHAYEYPATLDTLPTPHLFEFEAKALAQLSHPNILPLLDYNTETIDGMVVPFIVMPYCPEGSLASWLTHRTDSDVLTLEDAARLIHEIADALQYAHDQGIVHRDVKAANIFLHNKLNGPPDMLVADFGFAEPLPEALAQGMDVRGTPEYMAPEQWEGQVVPASDQYALGMMVYQLLTGRLPFEGSVEQVRSAHLTSWPRPPSTINPTIPRELDAVVECALAKKPGERYATVTAFADAFAQAIQPMPQPVLPPPVYVAPPPLMPMEGKTVTPPPEPPARRLSRGMIVLISAFVLLLVLVACALAALANSGNTAQSNANATATANANATATVAPAAALTGIWVNVDSNTVGIKKITIINNGLVVSVNPISRCIPNDCNWGTLSNQYTGSPFKIVFVVRGKSQTLAIAVQGSQLTVVNGNRTYVFNKA